jgi:hypothetical protein
MVSTVHASARVFRVRTEFITLTCEMRVHVLCECGSGAWIAAIAPFPDLFFDERPLIGQSVGEALAWLETRYAKLRVLAEILDSSGCRGEAGHSERQVTPARKPGVERQPEVRPQPEVGPQPGEKQKARRRGRAFRAVSQCELPLPLCPDKRDQSVPGAVRIGGSGQDRRSKSHG